MKEVLFIIQLFCCFSLFGLIWTIQIVHYPTFLKIENKEFKSFCIFHTKKISLIVIPLMFLELISGVVLLSSYTNNVFVFNFIGITIIWISTLFISMPLHRKLSVERNELVIKKLIKTNWIRTLTWSSRSLLLMLFAIKGLS